MQFGLAVRGQYEADEDIRQCFDDLVAQARLADGLGFASLTKTSHYSTHPLQALQQFPVLARLAAEAPNLRLNAGIVLVAMHKPLDIAEQLATLDVISGGRLIFGAGLGYREVEFKAFGTTPRDRVKRFVEGIEAIRLLWTEETVDYRGSHFTLDGASCALKPLQKPHPPIWIGANADPAIKRAALLGDCWYINPHNRIDVIERQIDVYRRALDAAGKPFPDELPMRREVFVAASREEAFRLCRPFIETKYNAYRDWGQDREMPADDGFAALFDELAGDRFLVGAPDEVAEQIIGLGRRLGVNHLIMSLQWPGMPQTLALETMHMLAEDVFPKVRQGLG